MKCQYQSNLKSGQAHLLPMDREGGQAIVELMVGLVAVVVLVAGLLQVASLSSAHTETMVEARRQAGERAMLDSESVFTPDYIRDWHEGPDTRRYTRDDTFTTANAADFQSTIVDKAADAAGWTVIDTVPGNRLTRIHGSGMPQTQFGLVRGYDSKTVDLLPAIQSLVYAADSIEVETEVWMTWTKGIY